MSSPSQLVHAYPQWEPPEDDPSAPVEEWREIWTGHMRLIRNRKRMRKLKRRGVPMWTIHEHGKTLWAWFVDNTASHDRAELNHIACAPSCAVCGGES